MLLVPRGCRQSLPAIRPPPPSTDSLLSSCPKGIRQFWGSPPFPGPLPGLWVIAPLTTGATSHPAPPQHLWCSFGPGTAGRPSRVGREGAGLARAPSSPSPSVLASQPRGHPFGGGTEAGPRAATPVLPAGSDDRDTPDSPAPTAAFTRAPQNRGDPSPPRHPVPVTGGLDGTEVGARWGAQGGDATPGRKQRRFVMQRNCRRRQQRGDASPGRRALTPAADTPGSPQLPAPRAPQSTELSAALAPAVSHRAEPEGAAPLAPRGPQSRSPAPSGAMASCDADGQIPAPHPQAEGTPPPRDPRSRHGQGYGYVGTKLSWLLQSQPSPWDAAKEKPQPLAVCPQPLGALISILLITRLCPPPAPDPLVRRSPQITDVKIRP